MAIWWKYLICGLLLNLAIAESENVVGATSNYVGGVLNYFVPGLLDQTPSNTSSNLEEDNDPKYNLDHIKWSNFYDELMAEIGANPLGLPNGYVDISIQRLNETSLYFRHMCLLHYDNLMETQKSEIEKLVVVWNSRATKALQISAESFKETLIERCKSSSYRLTDKYVTYIRQIFASNIVDFLIFMNEQKTNEDVAEIKELIPYGQNDLDAAAKHYVTTYRTLTASGERVFLNHISYW